MLVKGLLPETHLTSYVRVSHDFLNTETQLHMSATFSSTAFAVQICVHTGPVSAGTDNQHRALTSAES